MTIEVKVIADSTWTGASPRVLKLPTTPEDFEAIAAQTTNSYKDGQRITTLQLKYPRFIHAEFMTHRAFSRNASSSRAIPVERLIQDVLDDTAMPMHWGKNQPGMQAREETNESVGDLSREEAWLSARDNAIKTALAYKNAGYHKQIVNRLLEPFAHIRVVVTATDWDNFFSLRAHADAQPEIQALAVAIRQALFDSVPKRLRFGQWHLPYIQDEDIDFAWGLVRSRYGQIDLEMSINEVLKKISVARCARVSYLTHDGKKPTIEQELELYDRLVGSVPLHASPAEHQAYLATGNDIDTFGVGNSNFSKPWIQYRKFLEQKFGW